MNQMNRAVGSSRKSQQGLTMISMAIILVMVGFIALIALKLFPIYLESFKVNSHLENFAALPDSGDMTDREIISALMKRFSIDDVNNVKDENIFIERSPESTVLAIEYEVRTNGLGNVDMVVSFVKEAELR